MAYLLGDGYVLNTQSAMVLEQGKRPLFIHSDNAFIPIPSRLGDGRHRRLGGRPLDEALGASRVVPGSHRFGRHPRR
jgi:hypothetical protein